MTQVDNVDYFPFLKGSRILLVSHELTITGAPLMLVEIGSALQRSGAQVALVNLGFHEGGFPLPSTQAFRTVPVEDSHALARESDLIIANTAVANTWVMDLLAQQPNAKRRLIWCIHELNTEVYGKEMSSLREAAAVVFDSEAACAEWQRLGYGLDSRATVIHPCVRGEFVRGGDRSWHSPGQASWLRRLTGQVRVSSRAGVRMRANNSSVFEPRGSDSRQGSLREGMRRHLGVGPRDFLVSLFGTYSLVKGQDLLVETIGRMIDASPGLPLKLLLNGFQDTVTRDQFLGGVSSGARAAVDVRRALPHVADLRPYYLASDAYILNTQHPGECFGRVTIEAMASGLPVLATDIGGTREIVIPGVTGLLHPAGQEGQAKLADNIRDLLSDRRRARSLGKAGFKQVREQFTESRFYREFAEVVQSVLG